MESLKTFSLPADFQQKCDTEFFANYCEWKRRWNSRKTLRTAAEVAAISENAFLWVFSSARKQPLPSAEIFTSQLFRCAKIAAWFMTKNEFVRSWKCFFHSCQLQRCFSRFFQRMTENDFVGQLSTAAGTVRQWWKAILVEILPCAAKNSFLCWTNCWSSQNQPRLDIWRYQQTPASRKLWDSLEKLVSKQKLLWLC